MTFRIAKPSFCPYGTPLHLLSKGLRFGMDMSAEDPRSARRARHLFSSWASCYLPIG